MAAHKIFDVNGLACVVTGGASGIGLACARAMAEGGARLTLLDRDTEALDTAVADLRGKGAEADGIVADVTDRPGLARAIDEAARRRQGLDVLFANAGVGGGPGFLTLERQRNPAAAFENIGDDTWDRIVACDLTAVFATIRAAVPHMKARGGGRIIVTTSISAEKTEIFVGSPYVAAKAGAAHLVRQAALELARYNITVNAIAPGPVVTNISGGRLRDPEVQKPFAALCPMHRMGTPEDIIGAALFLASPAAAFITGAHIAIDGGASLGVAD